MATTCHLPRTVLLAVVMLCVASTGDGIRSRAYADEAAVKVVADPQNFKTRVSISAPNGQLAWADVARAVVRAARLDEAALAGKLPAGSLNINRRATRLTLTALNLAVAPALKFRVTDAGKPDATPTLHVVIDHRALGKAKRRVKSRVRGAVLKHDTRRKKETYGMKLTAGWEKADASKDLVILLHGYNSKPQRVDGLLDPAREVDLPTATFNYRNDQSLASSAKQLSADLKKLTAKHPQRQVTLIAHSMGCLVSRAVIEDPALDSGNVRRLIMVAPPTRGSRFAHVAYGLDVWEHVLRKNNLGAASRLFASFDDGLAEASSDLRPGSPFLRKLNARRRNPQVRYTIFLGSGGPLSDEQLASIRETVAAAAKRSRFVQVISGKLDDFLSDLDEVVKGQGDGAVAVKRGRLAGVDDTVVIPFRHREPGTRPRNKAGERLHAAILKRLKIKPKRVAMAE